MGEDGLLAALSTGDFDSCRPHMEEALADAESLRPFFQSLFQYTCVELDIQEEKDLIGAHPAVPLNAIKNLCSLRLSSPSRPLVEFATRLAMEVEPSQQAGHLPEVPPEAVNQPVFVRDLLGALEEGDDDRAIEEAAKLSVISDNKLYVMEILMEACAQNLDGLGLLGYSLYRAAAFCLNVEIGPFMVLLTRRVAREQIKVVRTFAAGEFNMMAYADAVLNGGRVRDVVLYGVSDRLWNLESVKQSAFRQGIAIWLVQRYGEPSEIPRGKLPVISERDSNFLSLWDQGDPEALAAYLHRARTEGEMTWALELGERWLQEEIPVSSDQFVVLDALQHLAKGMPESCLISLSEILLSIQHESPIISWR